MSESGTRLHILNALKVGVTIEEIMEVPKLCVAHGVLKRSESLQPEQVAPCFGHDE
jgi:hypothetical protein